MCRERLGAQSQLSQGHFWVWLASPGGKRKILGREGSWPLRRGEAPSTPLSVGLVELTASWQESFKRKHPGPALAQDLPDLGLL